MPEFHEIRGAYVVLKTATKLVKFMSFKFLKIMRELVKISFENPVKFTMSKLVNFTRFIIVPKLNQSRQKELA